MASIPNCDTATVTLNVTRPIDAVNDVMPNTVGAIGGTIGNILSSNPASANTPDTLGGTPAAIGSVNVSTTGTTFNGTAISTGQYPTINSATGAITVPAGTPAGNYVITYSLCEKAAPTNCEIGRAHV